MSIKKTIFNFNQNVQNATTEAEAKIYLDKILFSYNVQKNRGVDGAAAFLNSINVPTKKLKDEDIKIQKEKKIKIKQHKYKKYNALKKYETNIKIWREEKVSFMKIVTFLKVLYNLKISDMTLIRFCKENEIE